MEPSTESVYSTTEFHQSNPGAMTIFVENHSSVTVRVFSVRLDDCENVRELCGPRSLDVRIPPQSRAMVVRLLARDRSRGMIYRFGFNWQVDSTKVDA